MDYCNKTVDEALHALDTTKNGLSHTEANERQKQYGPNTLTVKSRPLWQVILQPFLSVFMGILVLAAIISLVERAYVDGIIILIVVLASAIMDYVQQYSTARIVRSLGRHKTYAITVRREGKDQPVDTTALVPGDIITLREGDKVPADARVLSVNNLSVDESQLTGESEPIRKASSAVTGTRELYEQPNMLFQGSFVTGGSTTAVVTCTGSSTQFGHMAALSVEELQKSPVEQKIDSIITKIVLAVAGLTIIVFGFMMLRGLELMEAMRYTIAIAVSAVPEGLPISISVVLAAGMRLLAKRRALVRSGAAMQSIGVITTIATDKTGTLTKNQLTVHELWAPGGRLAALHKTLAGATIPSNDPLDHALSLYTKKRTQVKAPPAASVYEFEHGLALSGAGYYYGEEFQVYLKGSPEAILHSCQLSTTEHEKITAELHHLTGLGYRVIAFAHVNLRTMPKTLRDLPKKASLTFDGFAAIADVLRTEAKPAIARAQAAGISVRMITGDHFETAFHIGQKLGLVQHRSQVFDSRNMSRHTDAELSEIIADTYVFSRVTPERKHRLLSLLKQTDITAMTGDGVNDVPALTNAHVGVAMGSGSDIAKDAGDIILLDDNFKTIVDAVAIGRTTYANIRRMVVYMLATNMGEVFVSVAALLAGMPLPLVPIQILWINLVTDTTTVIPLGMEPEHANIMHSPPGKPNAPFLSRFVVGQILLVATCIAATTLAFYLYSLGTQGHAYAQTLAFWTIAASQWGIVFSMRATLTPIWQIIRFKNPAFYAGISISIGLQVLAIATPLAGYLHLVPLQLRDIITATLVSVIVPLVIVELYKYIGRRLKVAI